jgi:transcriptional regulator with XRE-family HTH domain
MARITLEQLGLVLRQRRGARPLREVAGEIGISAATLSRVESGRQPDLETFAKICRWLELDPGEVLGYSHAGTRQGDRTKPEVFLAHFRAERTLHPETARHLGELILAVRRALEHELSGQ